MSRQHRSLSLALLALLGACAPAHRTGALSPLGARVTNEVIADDARTLADWGRRIDLLRADATRAPESRAYPIARATAWLAYARDAYAWDPRDGAADAALAEARRLVLAMERDSLPAVAASGPAVPPETRTRPDLWAMLDSARGGTAEHDAPAMLADAEIALVRASYLSRTPAGDAPLARVMSSSDRACEVRTQETRAQSLLTSLRPSAPQQVAVIQQGAPVAPAPAPLPAAHVAVAPAAVAAPRSRGVERRVHFALGSSALALSSRVTLGEVIAMLRSHPGVNVVIEGFTDARGTPERNRELAVRRADAVRQFLDNARLPLGRVTIAGIGADSATTGEASAESFARDRRVTLVFTDSTGEPLTPAAYQLYDTDRERDLQIEQHSRPLPSRAIPRARRTVVSRPTPR